ncbi:hypothetical protein [uncultured Anaerovibrio sp.]|uniref:hypothetical protein n=1 Tax=uncultured Anaerovibrio sp. TaxID=361586 RepID=UPI002632DCCC|nr:hypothetical protein [uncultured Anaerovibrio sp.]
MLIFGCGSKTDIAVKKQQERESFIKWSAESYQNGIKIFQEMDFSAPDKEKAEKAATAFFAGTHSHMEFSKRTDCSMEIAKVCPDAETLYYTAQCLAIIGEGGSIEEGHYLKDGMLIYYAELIPEAYSGVMMDKVLPLRSEIIDIYEDVVKPQKVAKEARRKKMQAEYNRTYSERVAKQADDDPYYDEEYYAEGYFEEDYDYDGYRVEKGAGKGREHPRQSGGGTRRWRNINPDMLR